MQRASKLIGLIYDAVADPLLWQNVLDAFIRATHGIVGTLVVGDAQMDEHAFVCRHGMSAEETAFYYERYAAIDGWAPRVAAIPEGLVAAGHDLWPEAEMVQDPAYQGFYGPRNWHHSMGGMFLRTTTKVSFITSFREKEKGPYGKRELTLLRALMPHLRRAALLHGELTSLRSQRAAFVGHLDRYPQAFLLTDSDRRVLFANMPGREITSLQDGLRVEAGQLRISLSREDCALRDAVKEIAADRESQGSRLSVTRPSRKTPYRLLLLPVPSFGAAPLGVSQPAVAIIVVDADKALRPDPSALRELFSLTPAEIRVTSLLVQGRSLEEAAAELRISFETVRTHVRRVFSKTSTNRQGELIALVLRSVPFERRRVVSGQ